MKRFFILILTSCCLFITGCDNVSIGFIGGSDEPAGICLNEKVKGQFGELLEKKPIRMFNVEGILYYDSGIVCENTPPRCGVMSGEIKKTVPENEIPHNPGEANFDAQGYQHATSITKEVNIDGKWIVFKKYDTYGRTPDDLRYCYYIKGHMNNAAIDSEFVVLTDNINVTFNDVISPMFSSVIPGDRNCYRIAHNIIESGDKWGVSLYADDITPTGLTLKIEQFGGKETGELQTGSWFSIDKIVDDEWKPVEMNPLIDYAWDDVAYLIKANDITELKVEWKWLYGELSQGYYRLKKEVENFKPDGLYDKALYEVYFNIE